MSEQQNTVSVFGRRMEVCCAALLCRHQIPHLFGPGTEKTILTFLTGWFMAKNMGYLPASEDVELFQKEFHT